MWLSHVKKICTSSHSLNAKKKLELSWKLWIILIYYLYIHRYVDENRRKTACRSQWYITFHFTNIFSWVSRRVSLLLVRKILELSNELYFRSNCHKNYRVRRRVDIASLSGGPTRLNGTSVSKYNIPFTGRNKQLLWILILIRSVLLALWTVMSRT